MRKKVKDAQSLTIFVFLMHISLNIDMSNKQKNRKAELKYVVKDGYTAMSKKVKSSQHVQKVKLKLKLKTTLWI